MSKMKDKIRVQENFVEYGTKTLDSKDRISLGGKVKKTLIQKMKVDAFQVLIGDDGDILLRPVANISSREAWLYQNPEAMGLVKKGTKEAKEGKTVKVVDLDKFIESL